MEGSHDPPFQEQYNSLFNKSPDTGPKYANDYDLFIVQECELPLIDLAQLNSGELARERCKKDIARASQEWGFFQVLNHGISREILDKMRSEQIKAFKKPFHEKMNESGFGLLAGSYRWGTPSATCLKQLAWSEAFHVPLNAISGLGGRSSLSIFITSVSIPICGGLICDAIMFILKKSKNEAGDNWGKPAIILEECMNQNYVLRAVKSMVDKLLVCQPSHPQHQSLM